MAWYTLVHVDVSQITRGHYENMIQTGSYEDDKHWSMLIVSPITRGQTGPYNTSWSIWGWYKLVNVDVSPITRGQAGPREDDTRWFMLMSIPLQEDRLVSKGPDLSITAVKLLIMFLWKLLTPPSHPPTALGNGKNWEIRPTVPAHNWTNADKTNHIIVIASQLTNWTKHLTGICF